MGLLEKAMLGMGASVAGAYMSGLATPQQAVGAGMAGAGMGIGLSLATGHAGAALKYASEGIDAMSGSNAVTSTLGDMSWMNTTGTRSMAAVAGGGLAGMALGGGRDRRSGFNSNRGSAIRR